MLNTDLVVLMKELLKTPTDECGQASKPCDTTLTH